MGEPHVVLGAEDVRRIGDYVKPWLRDLVTEIVPREPTAVNTQLLERMVRVEEELKAQRELMTERFSAMDDRFRSSQELMEHRFRAVDQRFQAVDQRFESLQAQMDQRFAAVDKRFESVDKRFDDVQENFRRTQWLIGTGFVLLTAVVTVFGVLA